METIKEKKAYLAPVVKSVSFQVEKGFAGSPEGSTLVPGAGTERLFSNSEGGVNDNYNSYFGPRSF